MKRLHHILNVTITLQLIDSLVAMTFAQATDIAAPDILVTEEKSYIDRTHHIESPYFFSSNSDSARLLDNLRGVTLRDAGALSSGVGLNGVYDQRVRVEVSGQSMTNSCPNHMSPLLSYQSPFQVERIEIFPGVSPVSYGGDNIGGVIVIENKKREISNNKSLKLHKADFVSFYRSNNQQQGVYLELENHYKNFTVGYSQTIDQANNYRDGNHQRINATLFERRIHSLDVSTQNNIGRFDFNTTHTKIPKQGFANQYMDMLGDERNAFQLNFQRHSLELNLFLQNLNHYMNKLPTERPGRMPMYTRARERGATLKNSKLINETLSITYGGQYQNYELNDWWPAVEGTGMSPRTFININNGSRQQMGFFLETDLRWSEKFSSHLGARIDYIHMNAAEVDGYNDSLAYAEDKANFNQSNRKILDQHTSSTLLHTFHITNGMNMELGFARKMRSPTLYERYTWAGVRNPANMAMRMVNWFGDGNGYVGDVNLKPEVAHTASISLDFFDSQSQFWNIQTSLFYSDVQDYIDGTVLRSDMQGRNYLQFSNHDAVLLGAHLAASTYAVKDRSFGDVKLEANLNYTRGYRKDGVDLYHILPWEAKVKALYQRERWTSSLSSSLSSSKTRVSTIRNEVSTRGFALFDWSITSKLHKTIKLDFSITNLFNKNYELPLGGIQIAGADDFQTPLRGLGRSYNISALYSW